MTEISATTVETTDTSTDRYVIDARLSRFTLQTVATGLLSAMGHNPTIGIRDFSGEINFNPEKPEESALKIIVKASSFTIEDDISAKDLREMERLMHQEVLESVKYPEILYEAPTVSIAETADALFAATLNGSLTLHGVSGNLAINLRVALLGTMLRASGDFSLNQTDYGIKLVSIAGSALKLKDELKFSFEIVARKRG